MTSPQDFLVEHNPFLLNSASDPWSFFPPDISTIHESQFNEITKAVEQFRNNLSNPQALLILGDAGIGKTHLLGRLFTYWSAKEHITLCATVDPIFDATAPMQHLMREITLSLDKRIRSFPEYSQFHFIVSRMIITYLIGTVGKTKKVETAENDISSLFVARNGEKSIVDQLAPHVINWFLQKHFELDRNFITVLFQCCSEECSLTAKRWLMEDMLNPNEFSTQEFNHSSNLESTAHHNLTVLGNLLAACHLPIVVCFDTVRSFAGKEQNEAFSHMLDTLIFECPSALSIISSRPDVWKQIATYLTPRGKEIIEKYTLILDYCSEREAKDLIKEYMRNKLPPDSDPALSESALDWLVSQIEEVDLVDLSPRSIITSANRILLSDETEILTVEEVLAQAFERIYNEMIERHEEELVDPVRLNEALHIYFSAQSYPASMISFKPGTDLIIQTDDRWAVIIHTGGDHELEMCLKAGVEYVRKNRDLHCLLFIDADNFDLNGNWWKTNPLRNEFELLGGHIFHLAPLECVRMYALHTLNKQIFEGMLSANGKEITIDEFYLFLQDTEFVPPFITIKSSLEGLIHQMLAEGETKNLDDIIAELRSQNWIISPESFMRWCIAQKDEYSISITRNKPHFSEYIARWMSKKKKRL